VVKRQQNNCPILSPKGDAITNEHQTHIAGGTGGHAGATGQGRFNLYSNLTPCNDLKGKKPAREKLSSGLLVK